VLLGAWCVLGVVLSCSSAPAASYKAGVSAFRAGNFHVAARELRPFALRGHPGAQAFLGFMYERGNGVPQSYAIAADLYLQSAEQGNPTGQYLLGLLYDKGHGLPEDPVLAYKWISLAAGASSDNQQEYYARVRNAIGSKLTPQDIEIAQSLAQAWQLGRRPVFKP
jgi:TPR repeat protein